MLMEYISSFLHLTDHCVHWKRQHYHIRHLNCSYVMSIVYFAEVSKTIDIVCGGYSNGKRDPTKGHINLRRHLLRRRRHHLLVLFIITP